MQSQPALSGDLTGRGTVSVLAEAQSSSPEYVSGPAQFHGRRLDRAQGLRFIWWWGLLLLVLV